MIENDATVTELAELVFSKVIRKSVRWVLSVPNDTTVILRITGTDGTPGKASGRR